MTKLSQKTALDLTSVSQEALAIAKKLGATEAEVALNSEQGFDINVREQDIETLEHHQSQSMAVSVYVNKKKGTASCSSFTTEELEQTIAKAVCFAKYANDDPYSGIPEQKYFAYKPKTIAMSSPWDINIDAAVEQAIQCETYALALDKKLKQCEDVNIYSYQSKGIFANSIGFVGELQKTVHGKSISLIAEDKNGMQRDDEWTVSRRAEDLTDWQQLADRA